jgi:hypothetical protein
LKFSGGNEVSTPDKMSDLIISIFNKGYPLIRRQIISPPENAVSKVSISKFLFTGMKAPRTVTRLKIARLFPTAHRMDYPILLKVLAGAKTTKQREVFFAKLTKVVILLQSL